ncbi:hypothetical protein FKM95_000102 [Candidatus Tremblaya phenacola]|nr:hypothetical protein FKM95_000102 [Candidatus Tremblaya phenacola]
MEPKMEQHVIWVSISNQKAIMNTFIGVGVGVGVGVELSWVGRDPLFLC